MGILESEKGKGKKIYNGGSQITGSVPGFGRTVRVLGVAGVSGVMVIHQWEQTSQDMIEPLPRTAPRQDAPTLIMSEP